MKERAECVISLIDACTALRDSLGCSDEDARAVVLNNIISIGEGAVFTLNLLHGWITGGSEVGVLITNMLGIAPSTREQKHLDRAAAALSRNAKFSLLLLGQFQIENCIRNIARELKLAEQGSGFYRTADTVLKRLAFTGDDIQTLNTVAMIRNTFHGNGIHHTNHGDKTITLDDDVTYEFRAGEPFSHATWPHVAHALECSIRVLERIFGHADVQAIADPMFDQYVWDVETTP